MADREQNIRKDTKITLYWLDKSRAQRIVWLLEELKLDYDLKVFKRGKDKLAPPELKEVHPLGKSPLLGIETSETKKPVIIAESAAIVEYVAEHLGKELIPRRYPEGKDGLIGAETEEWSRYRFLMHYSEGSLMTMLIVALVTTSMRNAPVPFFLKPITNGIAGKIDSGFVNPQLDNHFKFLEGYLADSPGGGDFFCGTSLSAADIMMIFPLEGAISRGAIQEGTHPKLVNWVRRMQGREAYKRAGERVTEATGEPYVPFSESKL